LLVSPADHVILDTAAFAASVEAAAEAARAGYLVTLGVVADRPETGYGYIERGADQGRWSLVDKFVEKPDLPTAKRYAQIKAECSMPRGAPSVFRPSNAPRGYLPDREATSSTTLRARQRVLDCRRIRSITP
jgi:hypothetical protein